jgi:hypothetical protein
MKTIDDIPQGESWATRFRVTTFCVDGVPVRAKNLQPGHVHPGTPQTYEGLGVIRKRDKNHRLVELVDTRTQLTFTVAYDDCWEWDTVEWRESNDE